MFTMTYVFIFPVFSNSTVEPSQASLPGPFSVCLFPWKVIPFDAVGCYLETDNTQNYVYSHCFYLEF